MNIQGALLRLFSTATESQMRAVIVGLSDGVRSQVYEIINKGNLTDDDDVSDIRKLILGSSN